MLYSNLDYDVTSEMEVLNHKDGEVVLLIKFCENNIIILAISCFVKIRDLVPHTTISLDVPLIAAVIANAALC